jgi:hypothetical protein
MDFVVRTDIYNQNHLNVAYFFFFAASIVKRLLNASEANLPFSPCNNNNDKISQEININVFKHAFIYPCTHLYIYTRMTKNT